MPIYTYECLSCGNSLERRQSFNDDPLTTHEGCGGALKRVIHPAGIVFKGSGFYNTDYKNGSSSSTAATTDASGAKPSPGGESTPAATPAAAAAPSTDAPSKGDSSATPSAAPS